MTRIWTLIELCVYRPLQRFIIVFILLWQDPYLEFQSPRKNVCILCDCVLDLLPFFLTFSLFHHFIVDAVMDGEAEN